MRTVQRTPAPEDWCWAEPAQSIKEVSWQVQPATKTITRQPERVGELEQTTRHVRELVQGMGLPEQQEEVNG